MTLPVKTLSDLLDQVSALPRNISRFRLDEATVRSIMGDEPEAYVVAEVADRGRFLWFRGGIAYLDRDPPRTFTSMPAAWVHE